MGLPNSTLRIVFSFHKSKNWNEVVNKFKGNIRKNKAHVIRRKALTNAFSPRKRQLMTTQSLSFQGYAPFVPKKRCFWFRWKREAYVPISRKIVACFCCHRERRMIVSKSVSLISTSSIWFLSNVKKRLQSWSQCPRKISQSSDQSKKRATQSSPNNLSIQSKKKVIKISVSRVT